MDSKKEEAFARAFVDIVRTSLARDQSVTVPRLGTFSIHHVASAFREHDDGRVELTPPRDLIEFDSALSPASSPRD